MILHNWAGGTEIDRHYAKLAAENLDRQIGFLKSVVEAALDSQREMLSQTLIKALNFHAIACLHPDAGVYRTYPVNVFRPDGKKSYEPPVYAKVTSLMDDMVNVANREWERKDGVWLAAFVLWRLNHIHPFINGNGRTARAASYFVLCVKMGGWLPGNPILPARMKHDESRYKAGLKAADQNRGEDLDTLESFLHDLINQQMTS